MGVDVGPHAARDLGTLVEARGRLDAQLTAIAEASHDDARRMVFELVGRVPQIRVLGLLLWMPQERLDEALPTLVPEVAGRHWVSGTIARIRQSLSLWRALSGVLPESFAPPAADGWERYRRYLRSLPDDAIWGESGGVGLRAIYVAPPYSEQVQADDPPSETELPVHADAVAGLIEHLGSEAAAEVHCPTFVLGGPGMGKSSLSVMLAARLAERQPAILIRLRDIDPERPLLGELRRRLAADGFEDLAALFHLTPELVIILDGFDELAHATRSSMTAFFGQVKDLRERVPGARVVLTGRDTLFSSHDAVFPHGARLFRLQPFSPVQITTWCDRWSAAKGAVFDPAPLLESGGELAELAGQPLMLFMLARMSELGLDLTSAASDRVDVYRQIVDWTCERHEALRPDDAWSGRELRQFLRVAGYTAFVRSRERLHLTDLEAVFRALDLPIDPRGYGEAAEKTILAWAFRAVEQQGWEFLHKSFGEYLAAELIGATCHRIVQEVPDEFGTTRPALDDRQATREWLRVLSANFITDAIDDMLGPMLADFSGFLRGSPQTDARPLLRTRLHAVYALVLDDTEAEWLVERARRFEVRPTHARSFALANLLAIGGRQERFDPERVAPGRFMEAWQQILSVVGRDETTMRRTSGRMRYTGNAPEPLPWLGAFVPFLEFALSEPDSVAFLRGVTAATAVFRGENLQGSDFTRAQLIGADFRGCNLEGAGFFHGNLSHTDLRDARLVGVDFSHASLFGADLRGCNLEGAKFCHSYMARADMRGARLVDVDFSYANLFGVQLDPHALAGATGLDTALNVPEHTR